MPSSRTARLGRPIAFLLIAILAMGFSCDSTSPDEFKISFASGIGLGRGTIEEINLTISHGGNVGTIELSLPSLPAGVTGSFSKSSITDADGSVTLTLTTAADAALGNGIVKIAANGGEVDYTVDMSVMIEVQGTYAITVSPEVAMNQGDTRTLTVGLELQDGFSQPVSLSVGPALTGITTSIAPTTISGTTTATLTITATTEALTSTRTLNVTGQTEGLADKVGVINLTVSQKPAVTILGGGTINMTRGATGSFSVSINRFNYTGDVSVSVTGLPSGVTLTPNPLVFSPQSNAVSQITVAAGAAPGNYTLTLSGSADGITIPSVTMTLTILN